MREYITPQIIQETKKSLIVKFGPLGEDIYNRTYSRTKRDGTQEDWLETCARVVNGSCNYVPDYFIERDEPEKLFRLMAGMEVIPGGRHLWVTGTSTGYNANCHVSDFTERFSEHFEYLFIRLMEGGGVGSNYSNLFINSREGNKPWVPKCKVNVHLLCHPEHKDYNSQSDLGGNELIEFKSLLSDKYSYDWDSYVDEGTVYVRVIDSREGWCDTLVQLLDLFVSDKKEVDFVVDVSNIRPRGSILRGFGGTASGPDALMILLKRTAELLNKKLDENLNSIDNMLIDHYLAMAVVSGGNRRSARMALKYWRDPDIFDFISCKRPQDNGERPHWSTNISVVIDNKFFRALKKNDPHATTVYNTVVESMLVNGEPGFINASKCLEGEAPSTVFSSVNPCGEIAFVRYPDLHSHDVCCLGHVNLDRCSNPEEAFRLMTRFLIRATQVEIKDNRQKANIERNRRIGVGILGYHSWLAKNRIKFSDGYSKEPIIKFFQKVYGIVDQEAKSYCSQMRIPECIKKTTIAPTGTISLLPGSSSGIQPIFSKFYIRRVRYANNAELPKQLEKRGINVVPDVYAANTVVAEYVCTDILFDTVVNVLKSYYNLSADEAFEEAVNLVEDQSDISLEDFLETQAMLQKEYVDNAISITINVDPNKYTKEQLAHILRHYLPRLKGITIFPETSMPLAPFQRLTPKEFEEYRAKGYPIEGGQAEQECGPLGCPIK